MSFTKEQAEEMQRRVDANRAPMSVEEFTRRMKAGIPVPLPDIPMVDVLAKANLASRDRGMNKAELAYSQKLDALGLTWRYEPLKLRLADLTYYSPDFMVIGKEGLIQFHEVKAQWKGAKTFHSEDDAKVKIKVAAEQFPWFFFRIVWKSPEGWQHKNY